MKRKGASDVSQSWKVGEIHPRKTNSKIISSAWGEKVDPMFVNDETFVKFNVLREILKWCDMDE